MRPRLLHNRYAGLNAPAWAILAGEKKHGVTWHELTTGVDEGDRLLDPQAEETALTLNAKCYEAAVETFGEMLGAIENGAPQPGVDRFSYPLILV